VLKANAEGITEYSIIYAGVNYSSDGEPVKFTVPAVDEDAKGSECSLRSTASNYMELDITAVIKDINNPQYVSSDTNVCYIW
jgi:hypothetical protein